jgi:5-methylcytosine-specific restriction endonuclease McrA
MAEYNRAHYLANRELYIRRARRRAETVRRERMAYLVQYFRAHPCVDCGEPDPLVLEFDHLGDKLFSIAEGLRDRAWQAILDEIAKCEVVCANCHRRRTAHRAGYARAVALAMDS